MPNVRYEEANDGEEDLFYGLQQEQKLGTTGLSDSEVLLTLIKCAIGSGIFAMPYAFYSVGWALGIVCTLSVSGLIVYSMHILFAAMQRICRSEFVPAISFSDAVIYAIEHGPPCIRPFSRTCGYLADFLMAFYHFGVYCVYVIYIATNLKSVVDIYYNSPELPFYMCALAVPLILTYLVHDLKYLLPFVVIANNILFFGCFFLIIHMILHIRPYMEVVAFRSLGNFPILFGTVLFSIESVGVIVEVESRMLNPQRLLGYCGILNKAMAGVTVFYIVFGLTGYWCYGDVVQSNVTSNMPLSWWPLKVLTVLLAIAVFCSYSLQGRTTFNVLWHRYIESIIIPKDRQALEYVLRITIVLASVFCALSFPDFGFFLSFTGSFCLSQLGIIFPALIDLCELYSKGYGAYNKKLWRDICLIIIGVAGVVFGAWASFKGMINTFYKD